jgi:hypothetical protein
MAVRYFVEPNAENPTILVRTDGMSVAEGIGPAAPEWVHVNSLASWLWDSTGCNVTREQAAEIAGSVGKLATRRRDVELPLASPHPEAPDHLSCSPPLDGFKLALYSPPIHAEPKETLG